MKKRLTALITALAMGCFSGLPAAGAMPLTAMDIFAAEETSGSCGAEGSDVSWSVENGVLTISGTGAIADYDSSGSGTCPWAELDVTSVVIGSGVTEIGDRAFYKCSSVKNVTLPDTLLKIGEYAFYKTGITEIVIPDGATTIGFSAFNSCSGLTEVSVPSTVEKIGSNAFSDTPWARAYKEENGILVAGCVLLNASDAKGVYTIPEGIKSIAGGAFYYSSATEVIIPSGVERIAHRAFDCSAVSRVTISETVTEIENHPFYTCRHLAEISVSPENPVYTSVDGTLYDKNVTELMEYPQGKEGAVVIPATVRKIDDLAFFEVNSLTSVTFPDGLESIGKSAFGNCSGLRNVILPDSVTSMGYGAFQNCKALSELTIGSGLAELPIDGFERCVNLRSVTLSSGLETIGGSCFMYCESLGEIVIPDSVTLIDSLSFGHCTSLKKVTMPASLEAISDWTFHGCSALSSIELPAGLRTIGSDAFSGCTSLKTLTIPETVTEIDGGAYMTYNLTDGSSHMSFHGAFSGCTGLESVTLNCPLTRINKAVFAGCTSLKSISIPDSVTDIDEYAFANCTSLSEVHFPEKLVRINRFAFEGCSGITGLSLPANLKIIGESAFMNCTALTTVTIPEKVWKIDKGAFSGCIRLTSAAVPASVTTIGAGAFEDLGTSPTYTYEFYAMNDVSATLYDGTASSVYIRTDNPDPDSFTLLTTAPLSNKQIKLRDVEYKDPEDTNILKAVEGGYIWTFSVESAGTYSLILTESDSSGRCSIGAAVELTVRDSIAETDRWIDDIIASQTDDTMDNFAKMSAVSSYLMKNFKYYPNDGTYLLSLGSVADAPYFAAYRWDSYVSPAVLCEFAKRIGGFDEIVDLYSCYADYGYTWSTGHYLCYCAAGDRHEVYNACPTSSTGITEYTMIDFTDTSKLYKLAEQTDIDLTGRAPLTIIGSTDSAAERYAEENGIAFSSGVSGDVNGDGKVTVADLVTMEKHLMGRGELTAPRNADLCKDSRIDTFDLVLLRKAVIENT